MVTATFPPTCPGYDSLQQQVYLRLWRTYDRLKMLEDELFAAEGISAQQYNTLRLLAAVRPGHMTVQEIGRRLVSRAPDMTRLLVRLEQAGYVTRVRRAENRRIVDVALADGGEQLLRRLAEAVVDCHQRQLGHLSEPELKSLVHLLGLAGAPHEPETNRWSPP